MNFSPVVVVLLATFIPLHAAQDKAKSEDTATRLAQEDEIREAVFRYEFRHNSSGQGARAGVYCISVGEQNADPPDGFMRRFAGFTPPVRKASDCSTHPLNGVVEKKTGKRGLLFRVRSVKWLSDTEVHVVGGYFEDGLSASGNTYTVVRTRNGWMVISAATNWIS